MSGLSFSLFLAWTYISVGAAFAAPATPSAPQSALARKIPENPFRCDRLIQYRGRTLPCDSARRRDGESLRSIMETTPDALNELEAYQAGRNSIRFASYTGTAGLVLIVASNFISHLFIDETKSEERASLARTIRMVGMGTTVGGIVYGYSHLRSNEDHLQAAIMKYNAAHPERTIEFLFKTEF